MGENTNKINLDKIERDGQIHAQELNRYSFPLHVFPKNIRMLIDEAHKVAGFPKDYSAGGILAATSVAIGNSVLFNFRSTQTEAAVIYLALVGAAGINKTHPLNFALTPIRDRDALLYKEYEQSLEQYEIEISSLKKSEKNSLKPPELSQYIISDATLEALIKSHSINLRGVIYYRDELISWVNDFNKYRKGSDEQIWLSCFSRQTIKHDRKTGTDRHLYIKKPFVSVVGTIQSSILGRLFEGDKGNNGFVERILFIYPQNLKKPETFNSSNLSQELVENYKYVINRLFELIHSEKEPHVLTFSPDALNYYKDWYAQYTSKYNQLNELDYRRSIMAKLDIYLPRFAIIIQMLNHIENQNDFESNQVNRKTIEYAIDLVNYFYEMALLVRQKIKDKPDTDTLKIYFAKYLKGKNWSFRDIAKLLDVYHHTVITRLKEN